MRSDTNPNDHPYPKWATTASNEATKNVTAMTLMTANELAKGRRAFAASQRPKEANLSDALEVRGPCSSYVLI